MTHLCSRSTSHIHSRQLLAKQTAHFGSRLLFKRMQTPNQDELEAAPETQEDGSGLGEPIWGASPEQHLWEQRVAKEVQRTPREHRRPARVLLAQHDQHGLQNRRPHSHGKGGLHPRKRCHLPWLTVVLNLMLITFLRAFANF